MSVSDKTNPVIEYKRKLDELEVKLLDYEQRIIQLEAKINAGITSAAYYVCNNDTTYDATNSKQLTVTNGIITDIE